MFDDATSLHFEIDEADQTDAVGNQAAGAKVSPSLRKRGKAKKVCDYAPQIVIGLAVTHDGLPVRRWVFSWQHRGCDHREADLLGRQQGTEPLPVRDRCRDGIKGQSQYPQPLRRAVYLAQLLTPNGTVSQVTQASPQAANRLKS